MPQYAVPDLDSEVEALSVSFEEIHDPQALLIVAEAPLMQSVEHFLP